LSTTRLLSRHPQQQLTGAGQPHPHADELGVDLEAA